MMVHVDHVSVQTDDLDRALLFYSELLGCPVCVAPFDFKDRRLCYLDAGTIRIELYTRKRQDGPCAPYASSRGGLDHLAFATHDLVGLVERLAQCGVRVIKPPFALSTEAGESFIAFVEGPDGQEIELRQEGLDGATR